MINQIVLLLPTLVIVAVATWSLLKHTPKFNKTDKVNTVCMAMALVLTGTMLFLFGSTVSFLKGILFILVCVYASVCDIKERQVPDCASVIVLIIGLMNISASALVIRAVECVLVFGFLLLMASLKKSHFGGADVKFISACFMLTGMMCGMDALIIGLVLSVICTLIRNKKTKEKDNSMPLIPYISIGFLTVILIGGF